MDAVQHPRLRTRADSIKRDHQSSADIGLFAVPFENNLPMVLSYNLTAQREVLPGLSAKRFTSATAVQPAYNRAR